jgi:hypothetical protein
MDARSASPRWLRPLAFSASALLLFALRWLSNGRNPDTFWHVAVGRWIMANRQFPHYDVFSWYAAGRHLKWMAQEWLFDVLAYFAHELGGFVALNLFASLILVATFAVVVRLIQERTGSFAMALALGFFCAYNLLPYSSARPNTLSLLLVAIALLLLEHKQWYWALGVMLLDVNLHAGLWPVYVVLIAIYTVGRDWKVLPLALLVPLLNPYGFELYTYPFATMGFDVTGIQEWLPPTLSYKADPLFVATFALIVVLTDFPKVRLRDALLAGAFTALGFSATRQAPFWFVVVIPILAPYMMGRARAIGARLREWLELTPARPAITFVAENYLALAVVAALATTAVVSIQKAPSLAAQGWATDTVPYPSDAVLQYLRDNGTQNTFTHYNFGGYLMYQGIQPFIDSRMDVYTSVDNPGETSFEDMRSVLKSRTLEEFVAKYGLTTLVVPPGLSFDLAMRNNSRYKLVHADQTASIYQVVGPTGAEKP